MTGSHDDRNEEKNAQGRAQARRHLLFGGLAHQIPERPDPLEPGMDADDVWLDQAVRDTEPARPGFRTWAYNSFSAPVYLARRFFRFVGTTPGQLLLVALVLIVAILAAGFAMSNSVNNRQDNLDELLNTTEPTSFAVHNLYSSLSMADTVATTTMVQSGVQTAGTQEQYDSAIDTAMLNSSFVAAGLPNDDARSAELITEIQRLIPVYTGIVETARTNNRQSNPVSVAYMAQASYLMRETILPHANELSALAGTRVDEEQSRLTRPQWVPLSGLLAAVILLLLAQWWLWRITRRRFNKGFLVATVLMALAIVWVAGSNAVTWYSGNRAYEQASKPWDSLTAARVSIQQARTEETLVLVHRQASANSDDTFDATTTTVNRALKDFQDAQPNLGAATQGVHDQRDSDAALLEQARQALASWEEAHENLGEVISSGDYQEALRLTSDLSDRPGQPPTTASAFSDLDSALAELISGSRNAMRTYISEGLAATTLVAIAVMLLSVAAAIAVVAGIRPRLQEYV